MVALGVPVLLALSLVPLASGTEQAFPGKVGKLVFQSNRDGNYELYTANADGSGVTKLLARAQTDEFNANWSPSGRQVVFQTGPPDRSTYDIWLVGADGTGAKALVTGASNDRAPQFCDERTVVFTRGVTDTNAEVFAIGTNGDGLRQLTNHPASDSFPTCNPEGTRVAFISARDGPPRIYEMTRTGTELRPLTDPGAVDPDYSSDGRAIAYVALDADRNLEVFTKNLATGKTVQRSNVKPPFEYRLPKFVPETGARRASGGADEDDDIVATHRNTQSGAEALNALGSQERPVLAQASGGAPQPKPPVIPPVKPGKCDCASLEAATSRVHMGYKAWSFTIEWKLRCVGDKGLACTATIVPGGWEAIPDMVMTRPKTAKPKKGETPKPVTITCKGKCGTKNPARGSVKISGKASRALLSRVRATQGYIFRYELRCGAGPPERKRLIVQFDGKGRVDKKKSDLNSDMVEDGKKKRRA